MRVHVYQAVWQKSDALILQKYTLPLLAAENMRRGQRTLLINYAMAGQVELCRHVMQDTADDFGGTGMVAQGCNLTVGRDKTRRNEVDYGIYLLGKG